MLLGIVMWQGTLNRSDDKRHVINSTNVDEDTSSVWLTQQELHSKCHVI